VTRIGTTRALLTGGIVGPALFVVVFVVAGATRADYDPMRQFVSLLMLSDGGWVLIVSFVITGLLILGAAVGFRRVLWPGIGARWAPIGIGLAGIGFIVAGIFPTDALQGYPSGTPPGFPLTASWHAALHVTGALLFFGGLPLAAIVLARRFAAAGEPALAGYSLVSGLGMFLFNIVTSGSPGSAGFVPDIAGLLQRISIVLGLAWLAVVSLRLRRDVAQETRAIETRVG
jgi:hypothetical protein